MSEYPDHLNPFKDSEKKKLGRSLSRSFRGLKGFLRQSFRKKKSKSNTDDDFADVEIRKSEDVPYNTIRNVMSMPSPPTYNTITSPALPRSRFKERLSRSCLNTYDERCNPFAEDGLNPFDEPPVPYRRRKSKKNAPLPPSSSNPDVYLEHKIKGSSKWSLTSSETDYTLDDKSEYSGDITYYTQSLKECLDNFNKEMDTLNKESLDIGGGSPNILERDGNSQICEDETENIRKSSSIDSADELEIREINNNETAVLNSTEIIPENSETKTPTVIVTEEYHEKLEDETNVDEREEKQSQFDREESKLVIQYYDEETNKETIQVEHKGEINEIENDEIELKGNYEESNANYGSTVEDFKLISRNHVSTNMIHTAMNSIPQAHEQDEYEVVKFENLNDEHVLKKLDVHDVNLEYIDDDNSSHHESEENDAEKSQSYGPLAVATTNSKDPNSHIPKQRKYKLNKLILLGENSAPE